MTQSAVPHTTGAAPRADAQAAPPQALNRSASEFLVELAVSLQKRAMYPAGHPYLRTSTERLLRRAEALLAAEPVAVFGIARDQLVVDGVATDPRHTIFRDLADRLHGHRLATLRLSRGIAAAELDRLATLLSAEPSRDSRGGILAQAGTFEHIRMQAIEYDRIVLDDSDGGGPHPPTAAPRRTDDLWVDLARLATDRAGGPEEDDEDPLTLARSIDAGSADRGYDREILGRLTRLAEELAGAANPRDLALQARMSKLLSSLRPGTLTRLLTSGDDDSARHRFVTATSTVLNVDAVMAVLEAVAAASKQEVSHHLLRLLHKMGNVTAGTSQEVRLAADSALRANVSRMLQDWNLDDPNPELYTAALDSFALSPMGEGTRVEICDPLVILETALESGASGPRTELAVSNLLRGDRLEELVDVLERAPDATRAESIWRMVATPERLRGELDRGALGSESTAALINRLGAAAIDPLLDLLASADDRATRATALRHLSALGAPVSARAVALLPDSPWYVQRNLFVLLGRLGSWPADLPTAPYLAHADSRVRREAVKLMLETPERRDAGLAAGMVDSDETIRTLALTAALEECPRPVVPMVRRMLDDASSGATTRALAIRILARSGDAGVVDVLVRIALVRKFRFLPARIAGRSPEVLAAVAGLASHWNGDVRSAEVLQRARRHRDFEIRSAAGTVP